MIYAGIDIAKGEHVIGAIDEPSVNAAKPRRFRTRRTGSIGAVPPRRFGRV